MWNFTDKVTHLSVYENKDGLRIGFNGEEFVDRDLLKEISKIALELSQTSDEVVNKYNRDLRERNDQMLRESYVDNRPKAPKKGFVYLLRNIDNNKYKIGYTKNPLQRIEQLSSISGGTLEYVHKISTEDCEGIESQLHQEFSSFNHLGEWFVFRDENIADVINLMDSYAS